MYAVKYTSHFFYFINKLHIRRCIKLSIYANEGEIIIIRLKGDYDFTVEKGKIKITEMYIPINGEIIAADNAATSS